MTPIATIRLPDWQTRLGALVDQHHRTPFAWGTFDCITFAADAVLACTGVDLAADMRGQYSTEPEALALLAQHGGVVALACARLGAVVPVALAQPGDIGVASIDHLHRLAVCCGGHFLAPGPVGLTYIAPDQVLRVWRITAPEVAHG